MTSTPGHVRSQTERNFLKIARVRRNGVSIHTTVRRRPDCQKRRQLQREEDAAQRKTGHMKEILAKLSCKTEDWLASSTFQAARHILAVRFHGYSNAVYGRVIQSIYETGQLRRQKIKGGGSKNAYGSEGPPLCYPELAGCVPHHEITDSRLLRIDQGNQKLPWHGRVIQRSLQN